MSLTILNPGLFSTFQDMGRPGYAHLGIPLSGVMDVTAAKLANQMVVNDPHQAVLELTYTGISLKSSEACTIAVCGAEFECFVNEQAVSQDKSIDLLPDDRFRMGRLKTGARAYLSVAGGYQLEKTLGSYSTLSLAGLGGYQGRALRKGDCINLSQAQLSPSKGKYDWQKVKDKSTHIVHARPGPEYDWFSPQSQQLAFSQSFKITEQSDRMGYRLHSEPTTPANKTTMLSTGLMPGSLQITPDGQSILAMRDAQTTGGYPRILVVNQQDLSVLAQAKPGDKVYFFRTESN